MYKKLLIVFMVAVATQLPYISYAKLLSSSSESPGKIFSNARMHAAPDAELVYQQVQLAVRSVSVQKDSGHTVPFLLKAPIPFCHARLVLAVAPTPFSKNYIDHIYPSHHFW